DDGSATADVTVYAEVYDANKALLKEDEFLAVSGKVSEDRFSGGMRITAEKVMDIGAARVQFGRQFSFSVTGSLDLAQMKTVLTPHRCATGLPLIVHYIQQGIGCEIRWPDEWRVAPGDALKQSLVDRLGVAGAVVEY
ncbi:MAG: DNA polymerase III subunit alpha, partial [Herminiimonas sp.]|nr:DNA polymerase III subunit alpha [Herminiimonas sp.]